MNPNNTGLFLLTYRNNPENNFKFLMFENISKEMVYFVTTEVVNQGLQALLFDVVKTRNYTLNEIKGLINMTRIFSNKIKRKIFRLIINKKLHIEILHEILKKLHQEFKAEEQVKILKILTRYL